MERKMETKRRFFVTCITLTFLMIVRVQSARIEQSTKLSPRPKGLNVIDYYDCGTRCHEVKPLIHNMSKQLQDVKKQLADIQTTIETQNAKGRWMKANSSPVCFGARGNKFGTFHAPSTGNLGAIKLVHLYGYVSCDTRKVSYWSYWGCGDKLWSGINKMINVVITTSYNSIILPPRQFVNVAHLKWYKIPGYNSLSPELVLSFFSPPRSVASSEELRLWYAEDLLNRTEGDNGGWACCDVYALYV